MTNLSPETNARVLMISTMLKRSSGALLEKVGNATALAKFFDFDDEEINDSLQDLMEMEEWDANDQLQLASLIILLYLKDEFDEKHGLGALHKDETNG